VWPKDASYSHRRHLRNRAFHVAKSARCYSHWETYQSLSTWMTSSTRVHAISVLQSHGMCVPLLQQVFQSGVISKLTYIAPAWWGFSTSADRQRVKTFLRRATRSGLWEYATTAEELVNNAVMKDCFLKFGTVLTTFLKNYCHPHMTLNITSGNGAIS